MDLRCYRLFARALTGLCPVLNLESAIRNRSLPLFVGSAIRHTKRLTLKEGFLKGGFPKRSLFGERASIKRRRMPAPRRVFV
jgi:hypothetical protein